MPASSPRGSTSCRSSFTLATQQGAHAGTPLVFELTVFVLGRVCRLLRGLAVTPALHSPLMSVTNAVSSVIIVGA